MNVRTHIYISRKRKYNLERCVSKVCLMIFSKVGIAVIQNVKSHLNS